MGQAKTVGIIALIVLLLIVSFSVFTVNEKERAILLRLGKIVKTEYEPGLHFKYPLIENVRKFDARVLTMDAEPERFLTAEKKNVIVDAFVKWRIADVARFYTSMGGDEARANLRLSQIIKDEMRGQFGRRTIQDVVSGERGQIMDILTVNTNKQAQGFGIKVIDVRIKRIDLPAEVSESVFRRMAAERSRVAKDLRSRGAEAAERIRADADRQRTVIMAEAYGESERTRGEGDALAGQMYADAFQKNPEFFSFYRSLTAYRQSINSGNDVMVLQPDSEFFKYFKEPSAKR